ncbi:MAG: leucine-rich repeat protein [Candidatus Methanomethylophilaceae archaeon]|nr:leucine-rich repeat protein [Candidatus Methanomethylophilaceae archaeon]
MDRKEMFAKVGDGLRDPGSLADAMEKSGFSRKDVNAVRFMVSADEESFRTAVLSEDSASSSEAVTRLSEETSIARPAVASLVEDMRHALGLERPKKHDSELMEVKNAGNNTMVGPGGFIFRPNPDRARCFDLYRYKGEAREVEIPEAVVMGGLRYEVRTISDSAFKDTEVESIKLHKGIRSVGATAFKGCSRLASIMIPETVSEIGEGAFRECSALKSIEVEEGSPSFVSVGGLVYSKGLSALLHVPGGIEGAVEVHEGAKAIGPFAFWRCRGVSSVKLPESLESIGNSAFSGCTGLSSIHIPASVSSIGDYAFNECAGIEKFEVDAGNRNYKSVDGRLLTADMKTLVRAPGGIAGTVVVDDVEAIGMNAFGCCEKLEAVRIGPEVRSIGRDAFKGCTSMKTLEISEGVSSIDRYAFFGCKSLEKVRIPGSVTSMGTWAFGECDSLKKAEVPSTLELNPTFFPQGTEIVRMRGKNN